MVPRAHCIGVNGDMLVAGRLAVHVSFKVEMCPLICYVGISRVHIDESHFADGVAACISGRVSELIIRSFTSLLHHSPARMRCGLSTASVMEMASLPAFSVST